MRTQFIGLTSWTRLVPALLTTFLLTTPIFALNPDEIVVFYNSSSPNSLKVARFYVNSRKIPPNHLIGLTCVPGEFISEELYRTSIVPQVRKGLQNAKLEPAPPPGVAGAGTIKCLVTTYDLPLRVYARVPTPIEAQEIASDQRQLEETLNEMERAIATFDAIGAAPAATNASTKSAPSTTGPSTGATAASAPARTLQSVVGRLSAAAAGVGARIDKMAEPARSNAMADFIRNQERVAGIVGLLSMLQVSPNAPNGDAGRKRLADLSASLSQLQQQYIATTKQLDQADARAKLITLRQQSEGLAGRARALDDIITLLKPEGTESCFDSELSLVFADQHYSRTNWIPNPSNVETFQAVQRARQAGPGGPAGILGVPQSILVSRIDGLTPDQATAMIETGLKVEATGLSGKLYLDARGLHGTDGYAVFDADLRRAADWLKQHSTIDVVLDDTDKLFVAKDCPDAALYCGWYSLHTYQDSCQWVKGAVGYHVASYEMPTLHDPKDTGWVPSLLSRGFCGTLGATDEPFLNAFPKPSYFFPLLLSGEFTQGEVFELTNPLLSWRIGYVGDPLYNPYKAKPQVKTEELRLHPVLRNAFAILRNATGVTPPATTASRPATAP